MLRSVSINLPGYRSRTGREARAPAEVKVIDSAPPRQGQTVVAMVLGLLLARGEGGGRRCCLSGRCCCVAGVVVGVGGDGDQEAAPTLIHRLLVPAMHRRFLVLIFMCSSQGTIFHTL